MRHSMLTNKDRRHPHSGPDAHRRDENSTACLLGDTEGSRNLASTRTPERVPNGDGAAVDVDLFEWDADFIDGIDRLRRERLVYLVKIYVILVEACHFEDFGYGERRAHTHDSGGDAHDCGGHVFAGDGQAQTPGC